MQRFTFTLGILAVCAATACPCLADFPKPVAAPVKQAAPLPPQTYEMSLILICDTQTPEYVLAINNRVGYRTVTSLKKFISGLAPGSTLKWAPDDDRRIGEPLFSSAAIADFEAFCRSKKIHFVLVPGG